jgi:hypothetical protein
MASDERLVARLTPNSRRLLTTPAGWSPFDLRRWLRVTTLVGWLKKCPTLLWPPLSIFKELELKRSGTVSHLIWRGLVTLAVHA